MDDIRKKAKELLENKTVQVVIGYGKGSGEEARAIFVRDAAKTDQLIFDETCLQNLAVYILKHEVKHLGKIAIVATSSVLRSIMILASEQQLKDGDLVVLGITSDGKYIDLPNFKAIEDYLATLNVSITDKEKELLKMIDAMTMEERWAWWQNEFSKCFKCYACRSACPMCYCPKCTTDSNQPQWIPVASHQLGNMEWHLMRAMHLAGRCINCGECAKACPMDIPLNLLTYKMIDEMNANFGVTVGMKPDAVFALSTFKNEDKENFIR